MKVVVGSGNQDKIKIVKRALSELHLVVDIQGIEVDSEVPDQPLDKETTKKGAIIRAKNAKAKIPKADFWIGLEAGLHPSSHEALLGASDYRFKMVTYACLIDKTGNEYVDEGEEIHLPEEVSGKVKNGEWFGDVIREYAKDHEIDENLITRFTPFTRAVQGSYVDYLKKTTDIAFRKKSSAVIIDDDNNYLIVQLVEYGEADWNFSGGGVEKGETAEQAVLRELGEELGTNKFQVIKKSQYKEQYDWPNWLVARDIIAKREPEIFRGQEVTYFLVKFTGDREDIKPDPQEIRRIKWVKYDELKDHFNFPRQMKVTEKIIKDLVS